MSTATIETPQHMQALALANKVRTAHQELRAEVGAGKLTVAEAMADKRAAGHFTIGKLLRAQTRWGPTRARKLLYRLAIPEGKRVESLTERQRRVIEEALS